MNRHSFVVLPLVIILLLALSAIPASAEKDYSKPVITAVYPTALKVRQAPEKLALWLRGEHFLIHNDATWDAREVVLFVRHTGKGGNWQPLFNNRRDGVPNPPLEFGDCYYDWPHTIRVWLPVSLWCDREGDLEFKIIKGKLNDNGDPNTLFVDPIVTSAVFKVPVKKLPGYTSKIAKVYPESFIVHQKDANELSVYGEYAPGSVLLLNSTPLKVKLAPPAPSWMNVELPSQFLEKEAQYTLQIRDPQNTYSAPVALWVYGPPKSKFFVPKKLQIGALNTVVIVYYSGQTPDKIEANPSYVQTVAAAQSHQPNAAVNAAAVSKAAGSFAAMRTYQSSGGSTGQGAVQWRNLAFTTPNKETIKLVIPPDWLSREGAVRVRLSSKAGSSEFAIPIRPETAMNAPAQPAVTTPANQAGVMPGMKPGLTQPGATKPGMNR